jgi:hypothetical protein
MRAHAQGWLMATQDPEIGEMAERDGDLADAGLSPLQGEPMPFLVARDRVAQERAFSAEAAAQYILVHVRQGTLLAFATPAMSPRLLLDEPKRRDPGDWLAPIMARWRSWLVRNGCEEKERVVREAVLWGDLRQALILVPPSGERVEGTAPTLTGPPTRKKRQASFGPDEKRLDQEVAEQAVREELSRCPHASQNRVCGALVGQNFNGRVLKRDPVRSAYDKLKPLAGT